MMSKTHITAGTTFALLIAEPTPAGACLALAGGALGGIMPDVDIIANDSTGDALQGEIIATIVIIMSFVCDMIFKFNAFYFIERPRYYLLFGIILFISLYAFGVTKDHRGFTHSLVALIIYSMPIVAIYELLTQYFMMGFFSHLFIDLFNKRGIQLFFPLKKRFCFGLYYADKLANKVIMIVGLVATVVLLINCFIFHIKF